MIGDDRIRDTHEQMMLMQVVLVKLSCGEEITWGVLSLYIFSIIGNKL